MRDHRGQGGHLVVHLHPPAELPEGVDPPGVAPHQVLIAAAFATEMHRPFAEGQPLQGVPHVDELVRPRL
jgi:hypothetical protein